MDQIDLASYLEEAFRNDAVFKCMENRSIQKVVGGLVLCEECDQEIPPRRLAVLPHATRCMDCQQTLEGK